MKVVEASPWDLTTNGWDVLADRYVNKETLFKSTAHRVLISSMYSSWHGFKGEFTENCMNQEDLKNST